MLFIDLFLGGTMGVCVGGRRKGGPNEQCKG